MTNREEGVAGLAGAGAGAGAGSGAGGAGGTLSRKRMSLARNKVLSLKETIQTSILSCFLLSLWQMQLETMRSMLDKVGEEGRGGERSGGERSGGERRRRKSHRLFKHRILFPQSLEHQQVSPFAQVSVASLKGESMNAPLLKVFQSFLPPFHLLPVTERSLGAASLAFHPDRLVRRCRAARDSSRRESPARRSRCDEAERRSISTALACLSL